MVFKEKSPLYSSEIERKDGENLLYVNYMQAGYVPSIADNKEVMARTIELLGKNPNVARVIFVQHRNYHYSFEQTKMLIEIANVYNYLVKKEEILSSSRLSFFKNSSEVQADLIYLLDLLKQDPIGCYVELGRRIKDLKRQLESGKVLNKNDLINYVRLLEIFRKMLRATSLIKKVEGVLEDYEFWNRSLYKDIFRPDILPNFTFTRLMAKFPSDVELIDQYSLKGEDEISVTILKKENSSQYYYHIIPPEFSLNEEHLLLLDLARNVLVEHQPKAEEFTDPERVRQVFFNISKDLVQELSKSRGISLSYKDLVKLARILVRHTIGFGLIEILMLDDKLQDIVLNAPLSQNPIFVRHSDYDECVTNIIPSHEDAESWAAKLRVQSGRPLDEANPVLDTDLFFENARTRVSAITKPLSPDGLAYSFRRHRDEPWTLPLFIKNKMLNSFSAGLLSFLIDGARTILIGGTRSSGKTSLLGALMLEIMPKYRIIVVEDTLELSVDAMRKIGYDILRMKVRSALIEGSTEVEASEGIRTSLRLGDSALIVGEVRSVEAKALYEAMRVGALANVVAGTIHGDSPYGIFDRVVNDLGVPPTSFKATDVILIANPVKTPDGLRSFRKLISLSEVRKHWNEDPLMENGFVDLLRYNVEKDEIEPSEELINGNSEVIKAIASNVKGWAGNWDAVYDNIILRGKIKEEIVVASEKLKKPKLLEAVFNVLANGAFYRISEEIREKYGLPLSEKVLPLWKKWLYNEAKNF